MSNRPYMKLFLGDYTRDTGHLTCMQHGAYLLLMIHYWATGGLPDDDQLLANITRMRIEDWRRYHRSVLQGLFHDGWKHKRLDAELLKLVDIREKRSRAAKRLSGARIVKFKPPRKPGDDQDE